MEELDNLELSQWVMEKCDSWRDHYDSNYRMDHEEYYRLWRGIWAASDQERKSERSRIITPALQQAVESSVAEVEEATFGRGKWFDLHDDFQDNNKVDIELVKKQLNEDMQFAKARSSISEVLINSAVYGTGIGEVYLDEVTEYVPAQQPVMDGAMQAVGVIKKERFIVKLRPILPQNFLIDPVAKTIEEALGCACDMFVPAHQVQIDIDNGVYRDVEIETTATDTKLESDQETNYQDDNRVRLTKYYGLVPKHLFEEEMNNEEAGELESLFPDENNNNKDDSYVEAVVIIANGNTVLKVESNPFMMQDRPIVAFQWDTVPSKFWGRGVCEKGYNSQKALDTELRARIDALALTVHPMMAIDASRMPRGAKFDIKPGKTFLTNGNPSEILQPFKFGAVDQITFAQGQQLQDMVQQATGAVDTVGFQGALNGEATASGISMALGAVIKRHKRTLLNFQENFLVPFIHKAIHRYMQFDPETYPVQDYKFIASNSLGIIAREYEVTQLVQLLQTMPADSPMYPMLVESIVESMNLTNRESILATIKEANADTPEKQQKEAQQQQVEQQQLMLQLQLAQAQVQKLQIEAAEIHSRVQQNNVETQLLPVEEETRRIAAMAKNMPVDDFEKAVKIAELKIKEEGNLIRAADVESNEVIARMQMMGKSNK